MTAKLNTGEEIVGMKRDINYLKYGQEEMRTDVKNIIKMIENMDKKFANKWVEKATISVLIGIVLALVGFVIQTGLH